MAKRRLNPVKGSRKRQPKYSIGSLILLLIFIIYYACNDDSKNTNKPKDGFIEKPHIEKEPDKNHDISVFTGKVIGIKDGDTFEILYNGQPERVRLAEIDCPESSQAFGKAAKQYASDLCFGQTVTVTAPEGRDYYGRVVGTVVTADGINVNEELVKAGLAWHYKQYSKSRVLDELEKQARTAKKGLWQHKRPVAPWKWRKNKRNKSAKNKKEAA
ncbi:thermonuclease family protein [Flavobacterium sp. MK4S-17]|uniref:thermonuclease family protein n=1 Tax=Flavobacterium sp. MK4S-17 TaxID=2543737 RepID=UPI001359D646|nr:thermonuclease family protein [Flavobacterium sp. MK4S-17]